VCKCPDIMCVAINAAITGTNETTRPPLRPVVLCAGLSCLLPSLQLQLLIPLPLPAKVRARPDSSYVPMAPFPQLAASSELIPGRSCLIMRKKLCNYAVLDLDVSLCLAVLQGWRRKSERGR
jgi:hypothetical protein